MTSLLDDPAETTTATPLLAVDDYHVGFKTERGLAKAVDGVSFTLEAGRTLGIVGESGSGKSVLNRSIMGLVASSRQIESGSVLFDGEQMVGKDRQPYWGARIGMIFQDPMTSLNPVMKVGKQVFEPLRMHLGLDKAGARERAIELFTAVGIPEPAKRIDQYPHELSGGMRQRVMIAIALAGEPEFLVADEPTTALDVTVQKYILDLLTSLQEERGMAMTLITHDLGVARGRTDEILVMYGGRVMEHAPTETLFSEMRHPYTEALLASIPRLDHAKHTRLTPIPGAPPDIVDPPPGCRFAPRCRYAQARCVEETPLPDHGGDHRYACFFPVGTDAGADALERNRAAGVTAVGLPMSLVEVS
ncbi:MAG: ABC transporter ATP-binding protein [Acidimicrobiales bacterium]